MKYLFFGVLFSILAPSFIHAQGVIKKNNTRQIKKNNVQLLNFTEAWVWEYVNEFGEEGEMAIYREPNLNYWLLTREASYINDEMSEWFILTPNGEIWSGYQDGEWNAPKRLYKSTWAREHFTKVPEDWRASGKRQNFGRYDFGYPLFKGKGYTLSYATYIEASPIFVAPTQANMNPIYLFNNLEMDAKLPILFPHSVPGNLIVLSQTVHYGGRVPYSYSFRFKYISPTEYYINLTDYVQ